MKPTPPTVYQKLLERNYAEDARDRATKPLKVTWAEFEWFWQEQRTMGLNLWWADGEMKSWPQRAPRLSDVDKALIFGRPIAIVDEAGLRNHTPPVHHDGKVTLELLGGPHDGKVITVPDGMAYLHVPALFPTGQPMRFYQHRYSARTGLYIDGWMPNDHIRIQGKFNWFGRRIERLLAWWDRRRS